MKMCSEGFDRNHGDGASLVVGSSPAAPARGATTVGWWPKLLAGVTMLILVGCNTDSAPKSSHFEHDHEVAPHWPDGLADLSDKLRDRVAMIRTGSDHVESDHQAESDVQHERHDEHDQKEPDDVHEDDLHEEHEHDDEHETVSIHDQVRDLVSWVGEVAADTDLSEADWIPLYEKSESLAGRLSDDESEWNDSVLAQIESLCELIDDSVDKIPKRSPLLQETPL